MSKMWLHAPQATTACGTHVTACIMPAAMLKFKSTWQALRQHLNAQEVKSADKMP